MTFARGVAALIGGVLMVAAPAIGARIHLKSGEVVEGTIRGVIVQKREGALRGLAPKDQDPAAGATYLLTAGALVDSIGPEGSRAHGIGSVVSVASDAPFNEVAILEGALESEGAVSLSRWGGASVARLSVKLGEQIAASGSGAVVQPLLLVSPLLISPSGACAATLLGELRKEKKAYRLIPALEVKTKAGWRTIPVEQIVEFSGTSATSTPAQKN